MVPHARNPLFTGREAVLTAIHAALQQSGAAGITQAITGLGGVGKSQTALEYAYRHRDDYPFVFWVGAGSEETLNRDYAEIARRLGLAVKEATDAEVVREGVKAWLAEHDDYLLILDNADAPDLVAPYLPISPRGHVLVTSRSRRLRGLRVVRPVELEVMPEDEAVAFLLARAGREGDAGERAAAGELAKELGYLPLALEQAGAYVAVQEIRFGDYLDQYRRRRLDLLERARPEWGDTERTVQGTWEASFAAVRAANPAAADLLTVSAFFAPEQIPYELLILGAPELGKPLAAALAGADVDPTRVWELLSVPANYSLLQRDAETESYSMHRLVQEVIRAPKPKRGQGAGLTAAERRTWAERAVRALNRAFPSGKFETWPLCERLLPHALVGAGWVDTERLDLAEGASLLGQLDCYLSERAQYAAAEPLSQRALSIRERVLGPDHPSTARSLNNLAALYWAQGRLTEAEPLYQRALAIWERALGPDHPSTATCLNNLAELYRAQAKLSEAEPLYRRALAIDEAAYGGEHPEVAADLNNLALLYQTQGKLAEAESLLQRALSIVEQALGPAHPHTSTSLNNLAELYQAQGKLAEAEPLYQRALAIREQALGAEHPSTATSLNNLAYLYRDQGQLAEAEPLFGRALAIREQALGAEHPDTALSLNNLAALYRDQGKLTEAEPLMRRALAILETALGPEHPNTLKCRENLASLQAEIKRK